MCRGPQPLIRAAVTFNKNTSDTLKCHRQYIRVPFSVLGKFRKLFFPLCFLAFKIMFLKAGVHLRSESEINVEIRRHCSVQTPESALGEF